MLMMYCLEATIMSQGISEKDFLLNSSATQYTTYHNICPCPLRLLHVPYGVLEGEMGRCRGVDYPLISSHVAWLI